jgi:adenosylcobinamide-phosphate synthase
MITFAPALAALIERFIGYPTSLQTTIRHPVQWIGDVISLADTKLNTDPENALPSKLKGAASVVAITALFAIPAWIIQSIANHLPFPILWQALIATPFIAQKSMREHVQAVDRGLSTSLADGRKAVSMIVGRDTRDLDESDVTRAALESLAENTADGIVAPLFWFAVAGLPGIVAYKVINTADSMIGHLSTHHRHFGFFSAKLDDVVNLPASRLTGLFFAAAALFKSKTSAQTSLTSMWEDASKHRSPNAGWPEAAMAGALGVKFGGPRAYEGEWLDLAWMGGGREELKRSDIASGLKLYDDALWIMTATLAALALVL